MKKKQKRYILGSLNALHEDRGIFLNASNNGIFW